MRIFLGIIFGLFFLIFSTVFLLVVNASFTILQPNYVKNLAKEANLYDKIPQIIGENILKEGNIPAELQDSFLESVRRAVTPQMVRDHLNSMIDQMFSNQDVISEDMSDINSIIINDTDLGFLISDSEKSAFSNTVRFNKKENDFGRFVINKTKILLISLAGSIAFLLLLFFIASKNYKSRLKWAGAYLAVLAFLILTNFLLLRFVDFQPLINLIKKENSLSQTLDQAIVITNIVKNDFARYFIYEFIILCVMSAICFVISALIHRSVQPQSLGAKK